MHSWNGKRQSFSCNRFIQRKHKAFFYGGGGVGGGATTLTHVVWAIRCNFKSSRNLEDPPDSFFGENLQKYQTSLFFCSVPELFHISQKNFSRFPEKSPDSLKNFVFFLRQALLELSSPVFFITLFCDDVASKNNLVDLLFSVVYCIQWEGLSGVSMGTCHR